METSCHHHHLPALPPSIHDVAARKPVIRSGGILLEHPKLDVTPAIIRTLPKAAVMLGFRSLGVHRLSASAMSAPYCTDGAELAVYSSLSSN